MRQRNNQLSRAQEIKGSPLVSSVLVVRVCGSAGFVATASLCLARERAGRTCEEVCARRGYGTSSHRPGSRECFCSHTAHASARRTVARAFLLSHLGAREAVEVALASDWAQTWCLLEQLQAHTTDKEYESLALLFVTMFDRNVARAFPEDTEILVALSEEGWQLEVASPRNANNCLLDALLLTLAAAGFVESGISLNRISRAAVCATCRQNLVSAGFGAAAAF